MGVMNSLEWAISHAVFVSEIDDEHREILLAADAIQTQIHATTTELSPLLSRLSACIEDHFAHEERLMLAARYSGYRWHRSLHDAARRRVDEVAVRILHDDEAARKELLEYLATWLDNHMRSADTMLGAFLRNHRRLGKITIRAGTKRADACKWSDVNGNEFDPTASHSGY